MGHTPVVSVRDVNRKSRTEFRAAGYFAIDKLGPMRSFGLDKVPRRIDPYIPITGDGHFDYVLDASGFSLTDSWGIAPAESRLRRLSRWRPRGIGLTLLPQAMGPFTDPRLAKRAQAVLAHADKIWIRDPQSAEYARELGSNLPFQVAPDITVKLSTSGVDESAKGAALLVPNWNLAQRGGPHAKDRYLASLISIARELQARGREVVGMSHEGPADLELIQAVGSATKNMRVLNPASGLACKRIIAGADLVIAGRYHALVSALSTGVPVIGHSWSHKYSALMEDFGVGKGLADPYDSHSTLSVLDAYDLQAEGERLRRKLPEVRSRVDDVWSQLGESLTGLS